MLSLQTACCLLALSWPVRLSRREKKLGVLTFSGRLQWFQWFEEWKRSIRVGEGTIGGEGFVFIRSFRVESRVTTITYPIKEAAFDITPLYVGVKVY